MMIGGAHSLLYRCIIPRRAYLGQTVVLLRGYCSSVRNGNHLRVIVDVALYLRVEATRARVRKM